LVLPKNFTSPNILLYNHFLICRFFSLVLFAIFVFFYVQYLSESNSKETNLFIAIFLFVLALSLRLYRLDNLSLFSDEIDVGYQAYSLLTTGHDYKATFYLFTSILLPNPGLPSIYIVSSLLLPFLV
jgi:hypothetical protein